MLVLAAAPSSAAAGTIMAVGDSITWGVTHSAEAAGASPRRDPMGGYPGRLGALLGGDARVLNRGVGGTSTSEWLGRLSGIEPARLRPFFATLWPDFRWTRDPGATERAIDWVLATDHPDTVLVLLGVNDVNRAAATGKPVEPRAIAARIVKIVHRARAVAPRVLVATLLPNRRDPAGALEAVNARLCELEPACVRLDVEFRAAGGLDLLGDEIHPSEAGHAAIAHVFAAALAAPRAPRRHHP